MLRQTTGSFGFLVLAVWLSFFFISCGGGDPSEASLPYSETEYKQLIAQGDMHFNKMHLAGWRQADTHYHKAYRMRKTPQLRDRRFLTLGLTALREKNENIPPTEVYKKIAHMGLEVEDFENNPKLAYLLTMVTHLRDAPASGDKNLLDRAPFREYIDIEHFDIKNSPLGLYLYLNFLDYFSFDPEKQDLRLIYLTLDNDIKGLIKSRWGHPLFLYYDYRNAAMDLKKVEKEHPQFAEFFLRRGDTYFRRKQYSRAAIYFRKALDVVPDYTRAINGLGGIFYFTVKDYKKAMAYYQQTLDLDPADGQALFGKGVSLHHLEDYPNSNLVLTQLLERQDRHHGEAYYIMAYNFFQTGQYDQCRETVEKARERIPGSGEVKALSGKLYMRDKQWPQAEDDYLDSLEDLAYPRCRSLFFLGRVNLETRNWVFFDYFEEACKCFAQGQEKMFEEIEKVDHVDIDPAIKKWMRVDRQNKYETYKRMSDDRIAQMQTVLTQNRDRRPDFSDIQPKYNKIKDSRRRKGMLTFLEELKNEGSNRLHYAAITGNIEMIDQLLKDGIPIDGRNKKKYTPLYYAILTGRTEAARRLVEKGADVNALITSRYSSLHEAAVKGNLEIARLLIKKGASLFAEDDLGELPIDKAHQPGPDAGEAQKKEHQELLQMLKPIHNAVLAEDTAAVDRLLEPAPERIHTRDEQGRTPFFLAVQKGKTRMAAHLLDYNPKINQPDYTGLTPLYHARKQNNQAMGELLLRNGAELSDIDWLNQETAANEAVIWHVDQKGWMVKMGKRMFMFDLFPTSRMSYALKSNALFHGDIPNGRVLGGFDVTVFLSALPHGFFGKKLAMYDMVHYAEKTTFVLGWQSPAAPNGQAMNPGERKEINRLDIMALPGGKGEGQHEEDDKYKRMAFLVACGDLVIFHAGSHTCRTAEEAGRLVQSIPADHPARKGIDIAFLPVHGRGDHVQNTDTLLFLKQLKPRVMFPLFGGEKEHYYKQFAQRAAGENIETVIHYSDQPGSRFFYR